MKHQNLRSACAALLVATFGLGACGGDDGGGTTMTPDAGGGVNSGTYYHFANSQLKVGTSANEAAGFAFDLDDKAGKDNALGGLLAGLNNQLMIDMAIAGALNAGEFVLLHSIRADSLTTDTAATWQIWLGAPQTNPVPKYDGTGSFTVATNAPRDAIITGAIAGGKFTGGPASVTLELSLLQGQAPLRIKVNSARLEANLTDTGCTSGRIGGAIKSADISDTIIPSIAMQLDARIAADEGCREDFNMCTDTNKLILNFFDTPPKDRKITVDELKNNVLIQAAFTADVDILKADGTAGTDGVKESVSIALGLTCVKGTYTAPAGTESP